MTLIDKIPEDQALDSVDIWFQDEARFGQQNTTTRLWAVKGSRPRAVKPQQFINAYLFGAVCPANGNTEALVVPFSNKEGMRLHMEQISQATPTGRHSVVIMDGGVGIQRMLLMNLIMLALSNCRLIRQS